MRDDKSLSGESGEIRSIVERAQKGDKEAFGIIVERFQKMVCAVARQISGNVDDAEDIAQEVFLRAYRSLPLLRDPSSFRTWLLRITRNVSLNWLRDHKPLQTMSKDTVDALEGKRDGQTLSTVMEAVWRLPEEYRSVVALRALGGLSYAEISEALGISLDTVKVRLHRARKMLRVLLGDILSRRK